MGLVERIVSDPEILGGKPVVRGTRIPVELVLKRLAEDLSVAAVIQAFPHLTEDDVRACVAYAEAVVEGEALIPGPA